MQTHPEDQLLFASLLSIFNAYTPFGGVDPAGSWLELAPTNRILPGKTTPRSNFCLLAFSKFLMHIPPFGGVDPVGPGSG
jgi:hypothetical protein